MGSVPSVFLKTYRFLGQIITQSTRIDPRHLEHFVYTYWSGELSNVILSGGLTTTLLGPQFPIWVSPKESSTDEDPDASFLSKVTAGDGEARGVYVDFALVIPLVQPRFLEEIGDAAHSVEAKSLRDILDHILPSQMHTLSPRCFWISGFDAPVIVELKPDEPRHPKNVESYHRSLSSLLKEGSEQAEEQALCLFCSWRFGGQKEVILIAGAGRHYRLRKVTRQWAANKLHGRSYSAATLKEMKENQDEKNEKYGDDEEDNEEGVPPS